MKNKLLALVLVAASFSVCATTTNNVQQQIDDLKAGLHQVHMNTNQKYSESWGLEDRANIAKLQSEKVDKSVFTADQQRQDQAIKDARASGDFAQGIGVAAQIKADNVSKDLSAAVSAQSERDAGQDKHINAVQDAAQTANDRASNLEVRADKTEGAIRETSAQVAVADQRSQNNAVRLDGVETVNNQQGKLLDKNQSDISALYGESSLQSQRLEVSNRNIAANKAALESTNKVVSAHSAQLSNHEQRLGKLEESVNTKFGDIDKRFDETDRHIDAGLSAVSAMANIPQVTEYQSFAVGAGVGARGDQSAVAVGFSARASESVVVKVSVAGDSQQKWTVGGGLSYGW